jgi:NitT/TauT family transport system substrate-binding protein
MESLTLRRVAAWVLAAAALGLCPAPAPGAEERPGRTLTLYTAMTATTPQIPLWAAIRAGWPAGRKLAVQYWKTLDDLRGLLLAGKGDIWVGHLEGFAQAAGRGAPLTLIAVTGWKKFYVVAAGEETPDSLEAVARAARRSEAPLVVAPQDSPAIGVLEYLAQRGGPSFTLEPMPPQQALLAMLRGSRRFALLPEPLVSALLEKKPELRLAASLEREAARFTGGPERLPLVGIAVKTSLLREEPDLIRDLARLMREAAEELADRPEEAIAVLPQNVREAFSAGVLEASLARDKILALPALEVRPEILAFLCMALPEYCPDTPGGELPPSFFPPEFP